MIRKIVTVSCFCILVAGVAVGQSPVYLAYIESDDKSESRLPVSESACIFMGSYEGGRFVKAPEMADPHSGLEKAMNRIIRAFPVRKQLSGVDRQGQKLRANVESTNPDSIHELGVVTLVARIQEDTMLSGGVLLSTRLLTIRILQPEPARLAPAVDILLRKRANQLWLKHLPERPADERPSRYTLKSPIVERIESVPGLLTITYPMDIEEDNLNGDGQIVHDDRGSIFFIYSEADRKVVRGEFGHPEWSPSSTVWTIKPELFFRIGTGSDVFFVGPSHGGWESIENGIFDLRTGREVLRCY